MYRRVLAAVVYTHRPIVLQFDLHHGLEDTILDSVWSIAFPHLIIEEVIDFACRFGTSCIMKVGFVSFLHFRVEGELGD